MEDTLNEDTDKQKVENHKDINDASSQTDQNELLSMRDEINTFIEHIDSLGTSFPLTRIIIQLLLQGSYQTYKQFVEENCSVNLESGEEIISVEPQYLFEYNKLVKQLNSSDISLRIVPRSLLVALVSQFDSFLGRIIKVLFYFKPELLNSSEKSLTFSQLVEFNSIDNAKEYIVEKEIETVLRKSHAEQFNWLENKFNISLKSDLLIWKTFIELTERRNLFVHANGVVSSQYIKVCREHGVVLSEGIQVGTKLDVTPKYFRQAYSCIYEIGVKLAHVLWRKLNPEDIQEADKNLNEVTYSLLHDEKNSLAINLLDFATETLKRHSDDTQRRMFVINRAQAYKWAGNSEKASEIIKNEDWSATSNEFKMAEAVLNDDFKTGASFMKKIDSDSFLDKSGYKEWPLFKEFRKSQEFLDEYEAIYGEKYEVSTKKLTEKVDDLEEPPSFEELGLAS